VEKISSVINAVKDGYLEAAYAAARRAGAVAIADEVQVGFGRVGSHLWAFETQDVAPDIVWQMQREGKLRHIALSNVNVEQLEYALTRTPIVAVQNLFNVGGGGGPIPVAERPEAVLAACEARAIAFLPFFPLAIGTLATGSGALAAAAQRHNCTPAQLAIAWLLARSPVMLPIPGTSKVAHLEENVGAVRVVLDPTTVAELAPNR